ncbi:MAG TPA: TonB family protein [Sphingomicrobium sp.]|jgi:protein TonB|nr:TonB family protein [Sphingomicrobium sp.]
MSSYRGTAEGPDRAKAIVAVIAVHALLAAGILTGLNVRIVSAAVERLKTFDIRIPPPPPPPRPPPPAPRPQQARKPPGAPAKAAEPSPVVAPPPKIPAPSPIPAAPVAGTGSATRSGASTSGSGTGAGGSGNGAGGGGDYSRFTPARRISKIPDREYRRLAATGMRRGSVGVTIRVNSDGSANNCRVARSSGDRSIDALMCELTLRYVRFAPARDPIGRAVAQDVTFYPNWWKP